MTASLEKIETERLRLIPASRELVELELEGAQLLAARLGAEVAPDWPPKHHDHVALLRSRESLREPDAANWWLHCFARKEPKPLMLIGVGGLKGPPVDGTVEIGYSVATSAQRLGLATEAVQGLIDAVAERGATTARAETLPELGASIRVLEKLGFSPAEPSRGGLIAFELRPIKQPSLTSRPVSTSSRGKRSIPPE